MAYTTINNPSATAFNTKLYSGNSSTQSITGVGFQPDFTWIKQRNGTENHALFDAVRGATKEISSNRTNVESTVATSLTGFDSDGFTLGSWSRTNNNNDTYASWNWKAGTTSGFEILTWTGNETNRTISHSLGKAPECLIIKGINQVEDWTTYQVGYGNTGNLILNSTGAASNSSTYWQDTTPSASVITLGVSTRLNGNGINYICYAFTGIQGYSKFGSYTGNGNADGSFIYTGFKPAFLIIKKYTESGNNWVMFDNKRIGYNESNYYLRPSGNNTESTNIPLDILSNGFKTRTTAGDVNNNSQQYIYMAFAEAPLVGTNNVPCTAR